MADLPQHLRARAAILRRQAAALDRQPFGPVRLRAGDDTWIGPTAAAFRDALGQAERTLRSAAEGLCRHAVRLEAQADVAAAAAPPSGVAAPWIRTS
ncbi:MAG: hypothetical protein AB7Q42_02100 [Acidimicrobiia bacterium]